MILVIVGTILIFFILFNNENGRQWARMRSNPSHSYLKKSKQGIPVWSYCDKHHIHNRSEWRHPLHKTEYVSGFDKLVFDKLHKTNLNVVIIDKYNLLDYIPDFPTQLLSNITINQNRYTKKQAIDYLGACLLERYGGLWLSPGSIPMKQNYNELFQIMKQYDIVTFGSMKNSLSDTCIKKPSNSILKSEAHHPTIVLYKQYLQDSIVGNSKYISKSMNSFTSPLYEAIQDTKSNRFHYNCTYDGTLSSKNTKLTIKDYMSESPITFIDSTKLLFVSFPYEDLYENAEQSTSQYTWINHMKWNKLIDQNTNLSKIMMVLN